MKPKWYEWIPIYGYFQYFKRYFNADKRTINDAIIAQWFDMYHLFIAGILIILIISIIKIFIL